MHVSCRPVCVHVYQPLASYVCGCLHHRLQAKMCVCSNLPGKNVCLDHPLQAAVCVCVRVCVSSLFSQAEECVCVCVIVWCVLAIVCVFHHPSAFSVCVYLLSLLRLKSVCVCVPPPFNLQCVYLRSFF